MGQGLWVNNQSTHALIGALPFLALFWQLEVHVYLQHVEVENFTTSALFRGRFGPKNSLACLLNWNLGDLGAFDT